MMKALIIVVLAFVGIAIGRPDPQQRRPLVGPGGVFFNGKIIHGIQDAIDPNHRHHHHGDGGQSAPIVQPAVPGGGNAMAGGAGNGAVTPDGRVIGQGTGIAQAGPNGFGIGLGIGGAVATPLGNFAIGNGHSISGK